MKAFASHFGFEFRSGLRNRTLLMMNYLFPLGFFVLAGAMMTGINPFFKELVIPAMVVFAVLSGTILGMPSPLVEAREAGILRSYKINGVPAASLLVIPALSTGIHMILVAAVITVTAAPLFQAPLPVNWPAYTLVYLLLVFNASGLGSLISVVSGSSRQTILWSQLIYLPSILLSGMMVPAEILPETFLKIGHLLPASYAMQGFLGLAYGHQALYDPAWALLILAAGGILSFALSLYLFSWDSQGGVKRGHPLMGLMALLPFLLGALLLI